MEVMTSKMGQFEHFLENSGSGGGGKKGHQKLRLCIQKNYGGKNFRWVTNY